MATICRQLWTNKAQPKDTIKGQPKWGRKNQVLLTRQSNTLSITIWVEINFYLIRKKGHINYATINYVVTLDRNYFWLGPVAVLGKRNNVLVRFTYKCLQFLDFFFFAFVFIKLRLKKK